MRCRSGCWRGNARVPQPASFIRTITDRRRCISIPTYRCSRTRIPALLDGLGFAPPSFIRLAVATTNSLIGRRSAYRCSAGLSLQYGDQLGFRLVHGGSLLRSRKRPGSLPSAYAGTLTASRAARSRRQWRIALPSWTNVSGSLVCGRGLAQRREVRQQLLGSGLPLALLAKPALDTLGTRLAPEAWNRSEKNPGLGARRFTPQVVERRWCGRHRPGDGVSRTSREVRTRTRQRPWADPTTIFGPTRPAGRARIVDRMNLTLTHHKTNQERRQP